MSDQKEKTKSINPLGNEDFGLDPNSVLKACMQILESEHNLACAANFVAHASGTFTGRPFPEKARPWRSS